MPSSPTTPTSVIIAIQAMDATETIACIVEADCCCLRFATVMWFWNIWFWMLELFMMPLLAPPYDWLPSDAHAIGEPVIDAAVLSEFWRMPAAVAPMPLAAP